MNKQWLLGFIEGEGCFNISFSKNSSSKRKYGVRGTFVIKLTVSEREVIERIRNFLGGIGHIYIESSEPTRKAGLKNARDCVSIRVTKLEELEYIVDFLKDEKFISKQKRFDFDNWAKCINLIKEKKHLKNKGLIEIAILREQMNSGTPSNRTSFCEIRNNIDPCKELIEKGSIPISCNSCHSPPNTFQERGLN